MCSPSILMYSLICFHIPNKECMMIWECKQMNMIMSRHKHSQLLLREGGWLTTHSTAPPPQSAPYYFAIYKAMICNDDE